MNRCWKMVTGLLRSPCPIAATGRIAPKDVAAAWVLERLPDTYRPVVAAARAAYLDGEDDAAILSGEPLAAFIGYARRTAESMLST